MTNHLPVGTTAHDLASVAAHDGVTALHTAAEWCHLPAETTIKNLLAVRDNNGKTAFDSLMDEKFLGFRDKAKTQIKQVLIASAASAGRAASGSACTCASTEDTRCSEPLPTMRLTVAASSVAAALLFFAVFFVGTSIWFVPFVSLGCITRNEAVTTVARMAMVLIALYYGVLGLTMLLGRKVYGY